MIPAELGKAIFAVGAMVLSMSLLLLPFLERGSAEFLVTVFAALTGVLILLVAVVAVRAQRH